MGNNITKDLRVMTLVFAIVLFLIGLFIGKSCGAKQLNKQKAIVETLKENLSQTDSISMEKTKDLNDCISQISTIKEVSEDKLDSLRHTLPKVRKYYISNDIKFRPVEDPTELQELLDSVLLQAAKKTPRL